MLRKSPCFNKDDDPKEKKVKVFNEVTIANIQRDETKEKIIVGDKKEEMGLRDVPMR